MIDQLNPKANPIEIKCKAAERIPLSEMLEFQGNLKRLSIKNRERLIHSICTQGFIAPIFIWKNEDENKLLDGHQRLKTLKYMHQQGWDIPDLPVAYVEAENEKDARQKLLHITSQYGEFVTKELDAWLDEATEEIKESIRLTDKEMKLWQEEIDKSLSPEYEFTTELKESHNYVVLYFDNDIDWQSAQEKLNIRSMQALDSRDGYNRAGTGRVIKGVDIIRRLID